MSVVQAAALAIDTDREAAAWNYSFFKNSALPEGVLEYDGDAKQLTEQQRKEIRQTWNEIHGGTGNAHRVAIFQGGMKFRELTTKQKDMEFLAQRRFSRDEILAMFRVPKVVVGITEDVNRASAEESRVAFMQNTVKPWMRFLVDNLNEFFVPKFENSHSEGLFLDFVDPVPEDIAAKIAWLTKASGGPVMTPNEARSEMDLEGVGEEGDTLRAATVDETPEPSGDDASGKKRAYARARREVEHNGEYARRSLARLNHRIWVKEQRAVIVREITRSVMAKIGPDIYQTVRQAWDDSRPTKEWSTDQKDSFVKAFVRGVENYEARYYAAVRKHLVAEKEATLANLKRSRKDGSQTLTKSLKDQVDAILTDKIEQIALMIAAGSELTEAIYVQFGIDAAKLLGTAFDSSEERIRKQVDRQMKLMATSVTQTTREKLAKTLKAGITAQESVAELTVRIEDVYEEASTTRARMIARTETVKAANRGNLEAYRQSGVVKKKQWLTSTLPTVCEFCRPLHGRIVDVDANFFSKGDVVHGDAGGELTVEYDDIDTPDVHPNCACTIVPIVVDD